MNRITEYKIEIKNLLDSVNLGVWAGNLWDVYVYLAFESGDSAEMMAGRFPTPIEAGKAAGEMENFFKFLSPDFKTSV